VIPADKIIVALDVDEREKLSLLLKHLEGQGVWVKVGMEIFYSLGADVIREAKDRGLKVFLDLKLHDIPNTVEHGIRALSKLPVDMLNVHAAGGGEMLKRSAAALKELSRPPLLIAVTQLTSTSKEQMNLEQGIQGEVVDSVLGYAKLSRDAGLNGVVCSPLEITRVKETCGKDFLTITPGIRPAGALKDDQKRVTTPQEALDLGTDFMVIGRPITQAFNPREALKAILKGK
jgi:orotidine-5'-phosphate decarboxylase